MNGSRPYLDPLEKLHTMLSSYPTRAEIASIHIADRSGQAEIAVRLQEAEPAPMAAGLLDWQRTLGRARTWAYRAPHQSTARLAVVGYGTECARTPVVVIGGPTADADQLGDLELRNPELLDAEFLPTWLGSEIIRTWPFDRRRDT
jgi:hypothetical protein